MSAVDRISTLIEKAEDLETRAQHGNKKLLEDIAKAYGEATNLAEKQWGNLSEETLTIRERWADSVRNSGNLTQATTCYLRNVEWSLESLKQHQGQNSSRKRIDLAQERHRYAQRQLAETHLENKKFSEAIALYEDILNSKAYRSDEELYKDRTDLASALFSSGSDRNIMRAVNLNAETLQKADQNLGRSHVETVRIRFNLAKELYSLHKYDDASEKYEELLRILEAKGCKARSSPDYDSYVQDTKTSLRNCSIRIAREQEERRKAEKIRRQLQDDMEQKTVVVKEGNVTSASAHKTDKRNQGEKLRTAVPTKVEEDRKPQSSDTSKQSKQPGATKNRERRQEDLGRETRHQVAETGWRTEKRDKLSDSTKEEKRTPTKTKNHGVVEGQNEDQSSTKRKADSSKVVSVADSELHLTNQSPKAPRKQNWKSGSVVEDPIPKDTSKVSTKSEAKRDLPIRPHSAAETLSPHTTSQSGHKRVQRSNSTRSDGDRSSRNKSYKDDSVTSKDSKVEEKSTRQKELAPSAPRDSNTQHEKADSKPTTQPEKKRSSSVSTTVTKPADRKRESDVKDWVIDTTSPNTSRKRDPGLEIGKEKHDKRGDSRNHERSNEQKVQRIPSAPSIVLSEPGHRKETQSVDRTKPRPSSKNEKERPKSSQSHYREAPSPLDIVNMDIERRKKQRSRSIDSKRVSMTSKAEDDLEMLKKESDSTKSPSKDTLSKSGTEPERLSSESSEKRGRKQSGNRTRDLNEPSSKVTTEKPSRVPKQAAVEAKSRKPYVWMDAQEFFESTNQGNDDVQQQPSAVEPGQLGSAPSDMTHDQSKPLETIAPSDPIPIISTDILKAGKSEQIIPGGWHQDFDEPDLNHKVRKSRSNDALSQGGLRVSQPSNAGHRRAASIDIPRPMPTPQMAAHIKDWSYIDEVKADEWFDRLQKKTHVLLDKYRDESYGPIKSPRRVRIAVLDTGVAKSTAKGPVPSLMKGPRVKIGKILDPSLPWNMDTKGHGTHAAGLILTVCPYADLYVYRVCDGNSHIDKKHVADAILDAVDKKKVDIISMSLGWEDNSDDALENALLHARANSVLIFAASSNEGLRTRAGMAFPARALEVIAIDASDVNGRPLGSNPSGTNQRGGRLTALGHAVRSTWPLDLATDDAEAGWKRLAGTSCATPIAAGIAGLILEFARQPPMCFEQKIEKYLKKVEGMRLTLRHLTSIECDSDTRFRDLDPTKLFHITGDDDDGGDWAEPLCPRSNAALDIVKVLRNEYGDGIGQTMRLEMAKELGRRHQVDMS